MQDARAGTPETHAELSGGGAQKIVSDTDSDKSEDAPTLAWIKWSQWTLVGTAVLDLRVCMNTSMAV